MIFLVQVHLGCPGQNSESNKTVVCVCVCMIVLHMNQNSHMAYNFNCIVEIEEAVTCTSKVILSLKCCNRCCYYKPLMESDIRHIKYQVMPMTDRQ